MRARIMQENQRRSLRNAWMASSIGWTLVISTAIGYGLGLLIKKFFHTGDTAVFICLLLGIAAGFVEMFRLAQQLSRDEDNKGTK
jgi:F0F1-type ATP synthase assembly protein I